ncbi:MAG: SDR family oxidoreductase [Terriglobia bacterium]
MATLDNVFRAQSGSRWVRLLTDIEQVLNEHEILLTGANGFLGKVILGLLLDRYPGLKHLHLLLRPARGLTAHDRFEREMLASPALEWLKQRWSREALAAKITVWSGDVGDSQCGLSAAARRELASRVALIINCAGKVDFFPPVDDSFHSNVDGVENIVALALEGGAKLLQVSTAFVCGESDGLVEEGDPGLGFYPRRQGPEDQSFHHAVEIDHCRKMIRQIYDSPGESDSAHQKRNRETADRLTALGRQRAAAWGWTNTYTYAKSLGEQVIASTEGLSYAIVRPAVVESSWKFPFPGWIEGGRTSAPLVLMALDGLREWPARRDAALEVVPVDMVAAAIVMIGGLLLSGRHASIYQLGSADVNPIDLEPLIKLLGHSASVARSRGSNHKARPGVPRWLVGTGKGSGTGPIRFLTPAQYHARGIQLRRKIRRAEGVVRGLEKVLGKAGMNGRPSFRAWKTALRALDLQITFREQTLEQYLPFIMQNRYIFEAENIRVARAEISPQDRERLEWSPEAIDWKHYWIHHQIAGIKQWVEPEAVRNWTFRI